MKICALLFLELLFGSMLFATEANAQILAESRFDTGSESWSVVSSVSTPSWCTAPLTMFDPIPQSLWNAVGGNSGGFIRHSEDNFGTSFFRAPAAFLGNKGAAFGGVVSFDRRLVRGADTDYFVSADDVYLQGGGIALIGDASPPRLDAWVHSEIPLLPGAWRLNACNGPIATEAQIRTVLENLTDVIIRAENITGAETNDLDNAMLAASCLSTWQVRDNDVPSARWRHAIAVDTDRNVLVLFGGDAGETETWEYALATGVWTLRNTSLAPSRRGGHAMVYDAARKRVVLTGGGYINDFTYAGASYSDVWEYDGVTGTWSVATSLPETRSGHAMVYDTERNTIVLYGGRSSGASDATSILERSSSSPDWDIRNVSGGPPAASGHTMAYDANRKRTVIFATGSPSIAVSEWDGLAGTWAAITPPATSPTSRINAACSYDPVSKKIIFAGGDGSNETWTYDGNSWIKVANIIGGGRTEHAMAYDSLSKRMLLSGGLLGSNSPQRDLVSYDPTTNVWTSLWSRPSPSPRDFSAATFDEVGGKTIIFGGHLVPRSSDNQYGSGTFLFDGTSWSTPTLVGDPGVRWLHTLAFDSVRRKVLLFGGRKGQAISTATAELWEFDPAMPFWSKLAPAVTPPARYSHMAAYDRVRNRLVVFGGRDAAGALLGDTWLYNPTTSTWTSLGAGGTAPAPRAAACMAFDEQRGVVVLFGGALVGANTLTNDVWEWNGTTWSNTTPPGIAPVPRQFAAMVYNSDRKTVVVTGGSPTGSSALAFDDVWEYDGLRWRSLPQSLAKPTGRFAPAAAYDRTRHQLVQFGGDSAINIVYASGQTWTLAMPPAGCGTPMCPADLNADQVVDDADFVQFVVAYNTADCSDPSMAVGCPADFDADGLVLDSDFTIFVAAYNLVICP